LNIGQIELFLIQLIFYTLIYLVDSYIGFLVCLVLGFIAAAILILSFVFEFIDKSKVPKNYYFFMLNATIAPFVVMAFFSMFIGGSFDWTKD